MAPGPTSTRWAILLGLGFGLYGAALLALRPASPFEWDEVLFQRALDRFDIARHSPHPPGYPLFVAVGRLVRVAVQDPMAALQLTSILGALAAGLLLFALARHLGASRGAAASGALLLCAAPGFAFHANVGLSDVFATAAGLACVLALARAHREPEQLKWAALTLGLASGVRPQVLALVAPLALFVGARCVRRGGGRVLAQSVLAGATGILLVWGPAVAATGPDRFARAFGDQLFGVIGEEAGERLPGAPLRRVALAWLVDPLGSPGLALSFWVMTAVGTWLWWRAGRRSLVGFAAVPALSYLSAAMWLLNLTTAGRYALPALPFLALLAAGIVAAPQSRLRLASVAAVLVWVLSATQWLVPIHRLRAEPAPLWAALDYVEGHYDPARTTVLFDPVFLPHVEYLLKGRGFRAVAASDAVAARSSARPGDDLLLLSPGIDRRAQSVFARSWTLERLARLTGGRYGACVVSRLPEAPRNPETQMPPSRLAQARDTRPPARVQPERVATSARFPATFPAARQTSERETRGETLPLPSLVADHDGFGELCAVDFDPREWDEPFVPSRDGIATADTEPAGGRTPDREPAPVLLAPGTLRRSGEGQAPATPVRAFVAPGPSKPQKRTR